MARPPSISNQQILDAARAVFLAHGLAKASTVDIARRAGVSEGSIFNRFPTKDDLFRAAMDDDLNTAEALAAVFEFLREVRTGHRARFE